MSIIFTESGVRLA